MNADTTRLRAQHSTDDSAFLSSGYKRTEVGVIPSEWHVTRIGTLFDVKAGGDFDPTNSSEVQSGTHPYPIYANSLSQKGLYGFCNYAQSRVDSITVTARGTLGKAFYRDTPFVAIGRLLVLEPRVSMDARFFFEYINYGVHFAVESTGVPQLTAPQVARYSVPVPPESEQRAIAEALSDVDGLIQSLEALIAKKQAIKQAAMQQLLTGKTRLPGFSGAWERKRLGEVASIRKGQLITESSIKSGTVPVVAGGKQPAYFHNCANRTGKTITVSASGAYAGYVAYWDRPIFASDCSTISDAPDYSIKYIFYQMLLRQEQIYRAQTGGAQPHVHGKDLAPLVIAIPPIREQRAIAAILSDMDAEIAALERRRDKTRAIKQGMMQQLLTGRVRLVEPEPLTKKTTT